MTSAFSDFTYDSRSYDLVRYREDALDGRLGSVVAAALTSDDVATVRFALDEGDIDLLTTYARRRLVAARRSASSAALGEAFDAYALLPLINDGELATWFKAGLLIGQDIAADLAAIADRFSETAPAASAASAAVVFASLERLEHLAQCHVVETHTSYGLGLLQTVVVRGVDATGNEQLISSGLVGAPGRMADYIVGYDVASSIANVAAKIADAFDALDGHETTALRHDQLVAAVFDIVTSGSYLPARACVSFHVEVAEGLSFSVTVADIDTDHTGYSAEDLADMADDLVDQAGLALGNHLVVLSVVPDFDELFGDLDEDEGEEGEYDDDPLAPYLDVVRSALL